jgi:hypothetical protein
MHGTLLDSVVVVQMKQLDNFSFSPPITYPYSAVKFVNANRNRP